VIEPWSGFPTDNELIDHCAEVSGHDLSAPDWYEVLACYKLGIVLEGTYARACNGQVPMKLGERMHTSTLDLFKRARRRIAKA
jgi:hypothetical protein